MISIIKRSLIRYFICASTLLLLFESSLFHRCEGSERKCFIVDSQNSETVHICYFVPNITSDGVTWAQAVKICSAAGANLISIPAKVIQGVLENYLDSQHINYSFWTSALKIQSNIWKWINGETYSGKHERCNLSEMIRFNNSCIIKTSNKTSNASNARNDCIVNGGDLLVIDSKEELNKTAEIQLQLGPDAKIWMGLRKLWWKWNEKDEIKYTNWAFGEDGKLTEECMIVDTTNFKWKQEYCNEKQRILCQTVRENSDTSTGNKRLMVAIGTGVVVTIFILLSATALAVIFIRKKLTLSFDGFQRFKNSENASNSQSNREYHPLHQQRNSCQGHSSKFQGHISEIHGRSTENDQGHNNKQHSTDHAFELQEHEIKVEGHSMSQDNYPAISHGHDLNVSQCQKLHDSQNIDHDHYAMIPKVINSNPEVKKEDELQKIIVYAQLEFDAEISETRNVLSENNSEKSTNYGAVNNKDDKTQNTETNMNK